MKRVVGSSKEIVDTIGPFVDVVHTSGTFK